jgi:hypothetical protein
MYCEYRARWAAVLGIAAACKHCDKHMLGPYKLLVKLTLGIAAARKHCGKHMLGNLIEV